MRSEAYCMLMLFVNKTKGLGFRVQDVPKQNKRGGGWKSMRSEAYCALIHELILMSPNRDIKMSSRLSCSGKGKCGGKEVLMQERKMGGGGGTTYIYIYVNIYVYVCICVYIYIPRDRRRVLCSSTNV